MIYKIKSSNVPGFILSSQTGWVDILDHTQPLQSGWGGYVNVPYGYPLGSNHMFQNTESITYEANGRKVPNYCKHLQSRKFCLRNIEELCTGKKGYVPYWDYAIVPTSEGWVCNPVHDYDLRWLPNIPRWIDNGWFETVGSEPDDSAIMAKAYADVQSGLLKPVFNLPRAVIELKDIPQTLRSVVEMAQFLKGMGQLSGRLVSAQDISQFNPNIRMHGRQFTSDRQSLLNNVLSATKGSLKDVAGAYLAYQFGIRPTASDVRKFLGLKWRRDELYPNVEVRYNRTGELWFEKRHIEYKEGQKIRVPYELGGIDGLPKLESMRASEFVPLLRDVHTENWTQAQISRHLNSNVGGCKSRRIKGLVFAEVAQDKTVDVPWSELLAFSGGMASTIYEVTPWTFLVDSICDVGNYIQTLERMSFPSQYRPVLKHGIWLSRSVSTDYLAPVYEGVAAYHEYIQPPDPFSGFGAGALLHARCERPKYVRVYQDDYVYERSPVDAFQSMLHLPPVHVPGRYMIGPGAALLTQFATGGKVRGALRHVTN